jgi:hypothetical protein
MYRSWVREVRDMGVALPAVVQLDRFPRQKIPGMSLCARTESDGEHYYLVVLGDELSTVDVAVISRILEQTGSPAQVPVAALASADGLAFWATGNAKHIVSAVNERLRGAGT